RMRCIRSSSLPPPPLASLCLLPSRGAWALAVSTRAGARAGVLMALFGVASEYTQAPRWDWLKASSAQATLLGASTRIRQWAKRRIVTSNGRGRTGPVDSSLLLSVKWERMGGLLLGWRIIAGLKPGVGVDD